LASFKDEQQVTTGNLLDATLNGRDLSRHPELNTLFCY
jgi:hypothetical protein